MEMKERKNQKAKYDEQTQVSSFHTVSMYGAIWECDRQIPFHIIILACMIQVFKLICFGENKVENVQKQLFPQVAPAAGGEPNLVLLSFAS